ncbi:MULTISPECIES: DUF4136 domain-containing protein [unclassified Polaromonas]|uniref:DUF4136 domain-containing protein n=1 Tax=unclassified Polaromonas TaxID=2638319 RepID=UPI001E5BD461|nr:MULTISPECIES: DUF4136 domain-containing protein [unclassified Polaromonas]
MTSLPSFPSPRIWLTLGVAALLTACASPITTRVTSFNQWPADAAGATFSYITPMDTTRQLEQATYEGYVQAELEKRGLQRAPAGQAGRLQVDVATTSRSEEKTWLQPIYQDNMVFVPPYRDAAGRFYGGGWVPDPFGPRYVGDRPVSMTVYTTNLRLRMMDTKDTPPGKPPRTVFESRAVFEGGTGELPLVVPYLVRAVFDDFPGQNGQVRVVKFDSETGAVIKK